MACKPLESWHLGDKRIPLDHIPGHLTFAFLCCTWVLNSNGNGYTERICTWKSGWCWIQVLHLNLCAFEPHSFIWLMLGWPKKFVWGFQFPYRDIWTVFLANLSTSDGTHSLLHSHRILTFISSELNIGSQGTLPVLGDTQVVLSDRVLILVTRAV